MSKWFSLVLAVILVQACTKDEKVAEPEVGYAYFPLSNGKQYIYRIDSISYDNNSGFTQIDTFKYYYKEQIGESFTDNTGLINFRINRFYSDSLDSSWIETTQWVASTSELYAIRTEDNRSYVKLLFPLSNTKSWDGNLFNNLGFERYRIINLDVPYQNYAATLQVQQKNDSNAIELIRRNEIYAKGIGLVYLKSDSINTQSSGSRGYRLQQTLISHQ